MCIVLLTTAHPDYALIIIDNRDEFILRPTSRPHWWTAKGADNGTPATTGSVTPKESTLPTIGQAPSAVSTSTTLAREAPRQILSSLDLQRAEHGTWLGITKSGNVAVLTNFREDTPNDTAHPIHGQRSRGSMVTAWLTAEPTESTEHFVERMVAGGGVRGVGGFSLVCGKLRKRTFAESAAGTEHEASHHRGLAIISNRTDQFRQVPWVAGNRGQVYGLSNSIYDEPDVWPKVRDGKAALLATVTEFGTASSASREENEATLRDALFAVLDRDTLPRRLNLSFEAQIPLLKESIFIPSIGDDVHHAAMGKAMQEERQGAPTTAKAVDAALASEERPDQLATGFMTGLYGTQRQTVILVGWDGKVSFTERALWDANGNAIPRGEGDVHYSFVIDGWDE